MERQRIVVAAGGVLAFAAFVAAGAFLIVSLAPAERPLTAAKGALLMETAVAPRPFNEATPPTARSDERVPEPAPGPPPSPSADTDLAERGPATPPPAQQPAAPLPSAPPHRAPRTVVAALPPAAAPSVVPAPPALAPKPAPRPERHPDGVLTPSEIRRFRLALRLSREQEPYWPPVEQVLMEIGAQQAAMVRAGQDPKDAFGVGSAMRVYGVAHPLLGVLREDQKARVREQARSMGFGSIASSI